MTTLGILQARMTSRLPGKVLAPVLGEPMIGRQLERLGEYAGLDGLVVATSTDASDDPLVAYLQRGGRLFEGPSTTSRAVHHRDGSAPPDVVVRLTADCPLTAPRSSTA